MIQVAILRIERGDGHSKTLASLFRLASLYDAAEQFSLARPLYEETLVGWRGGLGVKHSDTLQCMQRLGVVYRQLKEFDLAEALLKECIYNRKFDGRVAASAHISSPSNKVQSPLRSSQLGPPGDLTEGTEGHKMGMNKELQVFEIKVATSDTYFPFS